MREVLQYPLFRLGGTDVTVWGLSTFVLLTVALVYGSGLLRKWLVEPLLVRSRMQYGVRQSVAAIIRYAVLAIGFLLILQNLGIDPTALTVVAGAVGIGVGFGLQSIAANILSGFIILLERPIKIGDRIDVGGVGGTVTEIRARSTTVLTNDNIAIIVPNSSILSDNVINWSYSGEKVRFRIPVGVAFESDVRLVERLLIEVARNNPEVLTSPAPAVRFAGFGASTLDFELLVWTSTHTHRKGLLVSDINFGIFESFRANRIQIPYPQRDVHLHDPVSGGAITGSAPQAGD